MLANGTLDSSSRSYRAGRITDQDGLVYEVVRGYWLTRYLEDTQPQLLLDLLKQRYKPNMLEGKMADAYGMETDTFWQEINGMIVFSFQAAMKLTQNPGANKLIIVEGLTGLGKSTLAHFIARQLRYNDIEATWVHEGELGHPLSVDVDSNNTELFMQTALANGKDLVSHIESSGETIILEASFFNNLLETLFLQNVPTPKITHYSDVIQDTIQPLQPALVYLTHSDTNKALADNFKSRGVGFRDFVIQFATIHPVRTA